VFSISVSRANRGSSKDTMGYCADVEQNIPRVDPEISATADLLKGYWSERTLWSKFGESKTAPKAREIATSGR